MTPSVSVSPNSSSFKWPDGENILSPRVRSAMRQAILEQIHAAKSGHPGGALSLVEILASILGNGFVQDPKKPSAPDRDRLVLSKGHGVPALYAALSYLGYFPAAELKHLRSLGHFLQGHPDKLQYPVMEASTGSLGQGVSVALGMALGLRVSFQEKTLARLPRVYAVIGDGEMQEGQVWECLMAAGKFKPGNLTFILDYNKAQIDGTVAQVMNIDPIEDKLKAFGWDVVRVDGHNVEALTEAMKREAKPEAAPRFIVADTIKGKGVSFMEGQIKWHGVAPTAEELEKAIKEVTNGSNFGRILA